ncbi:MAG: ABC transporter ATP-binding protein [Bacteroidota bacterium]|nr:ABC transporter ATP-binding protein [Kiloniellaceae bacterium]
MLEIANVGKVFGDPGSRAGASLAHHALDGVSLTVGEHEIVSLVGTSGCGKSTLLRIVSGLDLPTSGRVTVDGRAVSGPTPEVGMVFQEPRLMPWLTVRENVRLNLLDLPRDEQEARIAGAIENVGLTPFIDAFPRQLSGGMAQRAAIARALVRRPSILLLDEPFSALDSFTRQKLQEHLLALWARSRFTLVFVTHDVLEAVMLSDRVLVMRGHPGRIQREIGIDLPRPRARTSPEVRALEEEIVAALDLS